MFELTMQEDREWEIQNIEVVALVVAELDQIVH